MGVGVGGGKKGGGGWVRVGGRAGLSEGEGRVGVRVGRVEMWVHGVRVDKVEVRWGWGWGGGESWAALG